MEQLLLSLNYANSMAGQLAAELRDFREYGTATNVTEMALPSGGSVPVFTNEFWTARQRQAHSLHEVSYRACFKPQLPRFFIERLTSPGAVVYDPFLGRGTTALEAALLGRLPWGCDINPLSRILVEPRLDPPTSAQIQQRLAELDLTADSRPMWEDLLVFYHPEVLAALTKLRDRFLEREAAGTLDQTDRWLRMVATNRLTGHSTGFFSVYSLPPNQSVSIKSQIRINEKRNQTPPRRNVKDILLKKSLQLLKDLVPKELANLHSHAGQARLLTTSCDVTPELPAESVDLVVTSPPFLTEVNYQIDNWLRCWFNGLDAKAINVWQLGKAPIWQATMQKVLAELRRLLKPGGFIAFEVGEVRKGTVALEGLVVPAGLEAGLKAEMILINSQVFTKTANCWGVTNQDKGTNSNRIVLFSKPAL